MGFNISYNHFLVSLSDKIYPKVNKVPIGTMASFECLHDSPVQWHYPKQGRPIEEYRISPMGYILYIPNVQRKDFQEFSCSGKVNQTLRFVVHARLKVIGKVIAFTNHSCHYDVNLDCC